MKLLTKIKNIFKPKWYDWEEYMKKLSEKERLDFQSDTVLKSANNHQKKIKINHGFLLKEEQ